jgi:hypothetical protein
MKFKKFKITIYFEAAGVEAQPQFLGRAFRHSQNSPAGHNFGCAGGDALRESDMGWTPKPLFFCEELSKPL